MPIKNAKIITLFVTNIKQHSCVAKDELVNAKIKPTFLPIKLTIDTKFLASAKKFANQYNFFQLINQAINQYRNKQF